MNANETYVSDKWQHYETAPLIYDISCTDKTSSVIGPPTYVPWVIFLLLIPELDVGISWVYHFQ